MWVWNFWKFQRDTLRQSKLMLIVGVHAWSLGRNMNSTSHGRSFRPTCSSFFSQSFVFINFFQAIVHVHIISISISVPFWLYCVIASCRSTHQNDCSREKTQRWNYWRTRLLQGQAIWWWSQKITNLCPECSNRCKNLMTILHDGVHVAMIVKYRCYHL